MTVSDLMTKDPICVTPDTNLKDVARLMVEHICGAIPVVDSDQSQKPIGIVTDRDITTRLVAEGKNPLEHTAKDAMTSTTVSVKPDTDEKEAVQMMERQQIRRLVVTDNQGRVCGMLSQADIARGAPTQEAAELLKELSQPVGIPSRPAR